MANISPSLTLKEEDLSSYVQSYSASQAGFVGEFNWGPIDYPRLIANEGRLASVFGIPSKSNNASFYTAVGYLDYSDALVVVRSAGANAQNATDGKKQTITAQISNVEGTFVVGETFTTTDDKHATIIAVSSTELTYFDESDQLTDGTVISGSVSGATATITSAGHSYQTVTVSDITGTISATDTITGGTSSASATVVSIEGDEIIYQLTTENDFIEGESVITNHSASAKIGSLGGIIHYSIGGVKIKNQDVFDGLSSKNFIFAAKYASELGNSLLVSIATNANFSTWAYKSLFDAAPDANEIHVVVIDKDGVFSESYEGKVLESYAYLSLNEGSKNENGEDNYYKNVINNSSMYLYVGDNDIDINNLTIEFVGGANDTPSQADIINSYKVFKQPSVADTFYYFSGLYNAEVDNSIIQMVEENQKTVLFSSPVKSIMFAGDNGTKAEAIASWSNSITKSNRVFLDCNWRQVFDTYNNTYVWVPCASATCGISSRCDTDNDVWLSPMGYTRGIYLNTTKLAWEPEKEFRDVIYKASVNPIFTDGSEGVVLLGDRTHVIKPSYFRQLAVRKTIIIIEQSALGYLKYFLGENNNQQTRALATSQITKFLRDLGGRGAFRRAQVVCNDTNNTEQVIDEQRMRCLIRIQPQSSINYIELTVSVVNSVAQFTENIIPGTF